MKEKKILLCRIETKLKHINLDGKTTSSMKTKVIGLNTFVVKLIKLFVERLRPTKVVVNLKFRCKKLH